MNPIMYVLRRPIDTAGVAMPEDLHPLAERLAEHTHDVWAAQRMAEGWTLGPSRDDALKHHPGLVPYDELPESEKQYDRLVSQGTIKAILALGYRIVRDRPAAGPKRPSRTRRSR
jgi:ryanodine receptor 2